MTYIKSQLDDTVMNAQLIQKLLLVKFMKIIKSPSDAETYGFWRTKTSTNMRLKMFTSQDRFYKDAIDGETAYEIDSNSYYIYKNCEWRNSC